jgi:hypothetical protein
VVVDGVSVVLYIFFVLVRFINCLKVVRVVWDTDRGSSDESNDEDSYGAEENANAIRCAACNRETHGAEVQVLPPLLPTG